MDNRFLPGHITHYLESLLPPRPFEMQEMETYARDHHFPIIGPAAGHFCYLIARLVGARQIFELGSGYGYSTAWFAKAVQENGGGTVHHVVWNQALSEKAQRHLDVLGFHEIIQYTVGEAVQVLRETEGPFDLIFNDIDKEGYPGSLAVIREKLRPGGVMIVDNVLWSGRIFNPEDRNPATEAIRQFTLEVMRSADWIASIVPIRDGLLLAWKKQ